MKKVLLVLSGLILSIGLSQNAIAQKGQTGLGLRLSPDGAGFTGKFFMDRNLAFEGQLNAGGVFGGEGESFNAVIFPFPTPVGGCSSVAVSMWACGIMAIQDSRVKANIETAVKVFSV